MRTAIAGVAYRNGWIDKETLIESAKMYGKSSYGKHLRQVADGKILY
ncbi:glucose-1-phosphate thymidylyltransferase [Roseburia sp. CAG:309]|nr:glucose-1-phosphate thymidylyltransferase [Roseburia sp. CAG:309]